MTNRAFKLSRFALATAAGLACLFISDNLSLIRQSSLTAQADARVGHPLTPGSVAGVARRTTRRTVRRDVVAGVAAIGAGAYYGAPGAYYAPPGAYSYGTPGTYYGGEDTLSYGTAGIAAGAGPAVVPVTPYGGPGYGYGPGPEPGSVIVNPATGRWCRTEPSGWQWCWTP